MTATASKHLPAMGDGPHGVFMAALEKISVGSLNFTTPEGEHRVFTGTKPGPAVQMSVHDWHALDEAVMRGQVGFAEAYIEGLWDSEDLGALLTFLLLNLDAIESFFFGQPLRMIWFKLRHALSRNTRGASKRNVAAHYNLGNDFYRLWLDDSMTYSSALFEGDASRSLEDAQQAKYRRILGKLNVQPGQRILEIGCGWGGFAEAAARSGVRVTGITLSEPQAEYAQARLARAGLDKLADIRLVDYRDVTEPYDFIVSIGMFEHVGEEYWPQYFTHVFRCLKPGGKAMIQSITIDHQTYLDTKGQSGFIDTYIFPGGALPSRERFREEAEKAGLAVHEQFGFGHDYERTLVEWLERFDAHLPEVRAMGRDEHFIRLWHYYLASCIASFASERCSVMQAELTRPAHSST